MSFVLPWGCTVFLTPVVQQLGLHSTLLSLFKCRVLFSIVGVVFGIACGRTHWFFLLINRVSSECVCRLIPLIIAQLSDEDIYLNKRIASGGSLRASVFGAANVVGKIGQSAAPMFGYMLLAHYDFENSSVQEGGSNSSNNSSLLIPVLVAAVPLVIVVTQFSLWSSVTLKGEYLTKVSDYVQDESNKGMHTA